MQLEAPSFSIDFPNTSANVRNDLAYKLDDEERRQIKPYPCCRKAFLSAIYHFQP
ncbi:MAG: hypothetical protein CM15mP83_8460 [Flavobacteriaceae bacterium]|nr:MAG: hypothetical protein CM15mP83_8460 [Flavobacteriaceae bacterium]